MNERNTKNSTVGHPVLITGGDNQSWSLAHGFTAYVHIHPSRSYSVTVQAPQVWDNLMFEVKRVLPLLDGFDVEIEPCIDGWSFKVKEEVLHSFIKRLDEIIARRAYYGGS